MLLTHFNSCWSQLLSSVSSDYVLKYFFLYVLLLPSFFFSWHSLNVNLFFLHLPTSLVMCYWIRIQEIISSQRNNLIRKHVARFPFFYFILISMMMRRKTDVRGRRGWEREAVAQLRTGSNVEQRLLVSHIIFDYRLRYYTRSQLIISRTISAADCNTNRNYGC